MLDGGMGTMIMRGVHEEEMFRGREFANHPVALKGCCDELCLTMPGMVAAIHHEYLEAGADIISTNTFNANALSPEAYRLSDKVAEINRAGVEIARRAVEEFCRRHDVSEADRPLVAGSMGPTGISLSLQMQESENPTADFDRMADAYFTQALSLIEAGADLLLLETVFDTLNAKAAVSGIRKVFEKTGRSIPLSISATVDKKGCLLSGENIHQFVEELLYARPLSFGLNCGFGTEALLPYLKQMAELPILKDTFISFHPNAGMPDKTGNYRDTPTVMGNRIREMLRQTSVNIIGGCCGTTPEHIRRIAGIVRGEG